MKNIIKDIEENCTNKSIEGIVQFLLDRGDLSYISEHYREIWHFYNEALKTHSKKDARKLCKEVMRINESKFKRVQKRYKKKSTILD